VKYAYVIKDKNYFVPRAASFCQARERNAVFLEQLGVQPLIVSPFEWNIISSTNQVLYLEVDDV